MALGTFARIDIGGNSPSTPTFIDNITVVGEASYAAGGSAFDALFESLVGAGREIDAVIPNGLCGGYLPIYIKATGKLAVLYYNTDAADGPAIEVPDATVLSGVTFQLCVISH